MKQLSTENPLSKLIRQTRQHHAIEHATIHLLSERFPSRRFSGHSNPKGFVLWGNVDIEDVQEAVQEALQRLQKGESHLAIHPGCGTNLATTGLCLTAVSLALSYDRRSLTQRFSTVLLFMTAALVFSRPLGFRCQHYTTSAAVQDRILSSVTLLGWGNGKRVLFET